MTAAALTLLDEPGRLRVALSPMRRQLLDRLRTPASATQLATEMTVARQRINYHLRELERAGFIELVEERQRRGCVERILAARAQTFVVDPMVVSAPEPTPGGDRSKATRARAQTVRPEVQDRYSSTHLIDSAATTVREVARMQTAAERKGERLLTFSIDTEIRFPTPGDLEHFTSALAAFIAQQAAALGAADWADSSLPRRGRPYRIVVGGHPSPREKTDKPKQVPPARIRSQI